MHIRYVSRDSAWKAPIIADQTEDSDLSTHRPHTRVFRPCGLCAWLAAPAIETNRLSCLLEVFVVDIAAPPPLSQPKTFGMGYKRQEYLNATRIFGCSKCGTHLTTIDSMISRQFNGQHGRAYLFENVVNIECGPPSDRTMTTGLHTVRDIQCIKCSAILGWKYDRAYEESQQYKEGKFILERNLLIDVQP
ncbi:hypothetical protein FRB95_009935 [Tulasnella sp. JGI-2019a]|nr:hypothetical protein FRB95_009935 [Tulasnella sp. JGI-2019a]